VYAVKFTGDGLADVRALPKNAKNFLKREIERKLMRDPSAHSKELGEPLKGWRSFSCGKYRAVFRIYEDLRILAVAGIGERLPQSRSDIYRKLQALAAEGKLARTVLKTLREFSSGAG
jgi:mRNA-degrading endonuclease RelE of RelBE toxin-antitoxin system